MKTTLIIFSKDRTLQLKSLLLSIRANYNIPEKDIFVIYKNTIEEISFAPLKEEFKCVFIEQCDFLQDIKDIVFNAQSSYIQFMVDDLIVPRTVDLKIVEDFMNSHHDVDSFCFRMGKNIKCGDLPEFQEYENDILTWNTSNKCGNHWNYAWDMSSSLYRKTTVIEYLNKCRHHKETFPNPFEDHYYQSMPNTKNQPVLIKMVNFCRFLFKKKHMKIACLSKSKCFTQGVNLVANIAGDNREEHFDPVSLHKRMLDGYIIDFQSLKNVYSEQPNAGHKFFKLIKQN